MGEQQQNAGDGGQGGDGKAEFKAPASQEEFDRMVADRLTRERSKFADYDDLKTKASKLDEIEAANKTELEKERERAAAAEKRASDAEGKALRTEVAAAKGVPAASLTGTTKEELEASADQLIAWRDEAAGKKPAAKKTAEQLKSGSASGDDGSGRERAATALRQLRGNT